MLCIFSPREILIDPGLNQWIFPEKDNLVGKLSCPDPISKMAGDEGPKACEFGASELFESFPEPNSTTGTGTHGKRYCIFQKGGLRDKCNIDGHDCPQFGKGFVTWMAVLRNAIPKYRYVSDQEQCSRLMQYIYSLVTYAEPLRTDLYYIEHQEERVQRAEESESLQKRFRKIRDDWTRDFCNRSLQLIQTSRDADSPEESNRTAINTCLGLEGAFQGLDCPLNTHEKLAFTKECLIDETPPLVTIATELFDWKTETESFLQMIWAEDDRERRH